LFAALATGRPVSAHWDAWPGQVAGLLYQSEGSAGPAAPPYCGGNDERGGVLGGRDADIGTVQAYKGDDSLLAMALETALTG
jgi:hypothetical protein